KVATVLTASTGPTRRMSIYPECAARAAHNAILSLISMPTTFPLTYRPFLAGILLAGGLCAQETAVLIRGARVFDGTGAPARVADTLIRRGRIEAGGSGLAAPEGARGIEAPGQTLIPGLFDLHADLSASAATGIPGDWIKNLKAYLACGVTTVNDFAPYVEMYAPVRRILASPALPAPRVNLAVRFSTTGGHGTEGGWGDWM